MSKTPSTMLTLNSSLPGFKLPDTEGNLVSSDDFAVSRALLVVFMCNHCPFVKHVRSELAKLGRDYISHGLAMVGINSNDVENYPDDSPENMKREKQSAGYDFPYLFDSSQETAKAFRAACTPDFYLFDENRKLVYRGQLDDSRPSNGIPVTGNSLRAAIDALLSGRPVSQEQKPSLGCNIKWKPGNEPEYFG